MLFRPERIQLGVAHRQPQAHRLSFDAIQIARLPTELRARLVSRDGFGNGYCLAVSVEHCDIKFAGLDIDVDVQSCSCEHKGFGQQRAWFVARIARDETVSSQHRQTHGAFVRIVVVVASVCPQM